jgi:hypothetical protein
LHKSRNVAQGVDGSADADAPNYEQPGFSTRAIVTSGIWFTIYDGGHTTKSVLGR